MATLFILKLNPFILKYLDYPDSNMNYQHSQYLEKLLMKVIDDNSSLQINVGVMETRMEHMHQILKQVIDDNKLLQLKIYALEQNQKYRNAKVGHVLIEELD